MGVPEVSVWGDGADGKISPKKKYNIFNSRIFEQAYALTFFAMWQFGKFADWIRGKKKNKRKSKSGGGGGAPERPPPGLLEPGRPDSGIRHSFIKIGVNANIRLRSSLCNQR